MVEVEEEKKRLEGEAAQLKEMLRREHDSAEGENTRNQAIIGDYKQVSISVYFISSDVFGINIEILQPQIFFNYHLVCKMVNSFVDLLTT